MRIQPARDIESIRSPWRTGACVALIAALAAWAYWPGVRAFWGLDDYFLLAFSRLLNTPWTLFVRDHFPVPGAVFRPLGSASLWLSAYVLGTGYRINAIADLGLHAAVSIVLFSCLRRARIAYVLALPCALLFALHPAVIATALWWTERFDLLAALCALLAVRAALSYREKPTTAALSGTLAALLAAMLAKETGMAAAAAVSLLWLHWAWRDHAESQRALRATGMVCLCVLVFLAWRTAVLGTLSSSYTLTMPLSSAFAQGLSNWARQAPGYLTFWPRLHSPSRIALALASVGFIVAVFVGRTRSGAQGTRLRTGLALCGAALLLLPALLQAPGTAFSVPLDQNMSAVETTQQARLYYLALTGLSMLLAFLLTMLNQRARLAGVLAVWLAVGTYAFAAHAHAHAYARRARDISATARAAVAAVAELELPPPPCHVMLLSVEPPPEWQVFVSADAIIKALSPELARVQRCWFHANYGSTVYQQPTPALPGDALPYLPAEANGKPLPWRTVGNVVFAYLRPPPHIDANALARMKFLRYRDGHFDDVSADVAARRIAVELK